MGLGWALCLDVSCVLCPSPCRQHLAFDRKLLLLSFNKEMGQWAMGQWENGLLGWEERSILYYFELQHAFSKRGASYAILGFFFS
jgi:hypothetical protein